MATYGDLSRFTYGELTQLRLTNEELNNLSLSELVTLAQKKLDNFHPKTEKDNIIKQLMLKIVFIVGQCLIDRQVNYLIDNWSDVIKNIINLLSIS